MRLAARARGWAERLFAPALGLCCGCWLAVLPLAGASGVERPIGVIDLHVDLSYQINFKNKGLAEASGQYLASQLVASGVEGVVLPLFIPKSVSPQGPRLSDLESSYRNMIGALQQTSPYALPGARLPGRVRTWFSFEGGAPFAGAHDAIATWVGRSAALFGLLHSDDNVLGTSAGRGPALPKVKKGLSTEGTAVAERVLSEGGVLDVSHASDQTTWDLVRLAERTGQPVVASHSNARAVHAHARNLPDDLAQAIAKTGGVIGVNFHAPFLSPNAQASISDVVRHIRHWVSLLGVNHVAIGSDFEGDIRPAQELGDVRGFPKLAQALLASGFSRAEVSQMFGLNALRVLCDGKRGAKAPPCQ